MRRSHLNNYLLLAFSVLWLGSCANNVHLRPQQELQPGDKVFQVYSEINIIGRDTPYQSYDIAETGLSPYRYGVSLYQGLESMELGLRLGYGPAEQWGAVMNAGVDLAKIQQANSTFRIGVYLENNGIIPTSGAVGKSGSVMAIRPYISSISRPYQPLYAGAHLIFSNGRLPIQAEFNQSGAYNYNASRYGFGVSLGSEEAFGAFTFQGQIDANFIITDHTVDEGIRALAGEYDEVMDLHHEGFYVGIGVGLQRRTEGSSAKSPASRNWPSASALSHPTPDKKIEYDPFTGQARSPEVKPLPVFDPYTGEQLAASPKFDPLTGESVSAQAVAGEQSLLSPLQRSVLRSKTIYVTELNHGIYAAEISDLRYDGILVTRLGPGGVQTPYVIAWSDLQQLHMRGARLGLSHGLQTCASTLGACVGIPFLVMQLTGEESAFQLGLITSPLLATASIVIGSLQRDELSVDFESQAASRIITPDQRRDIIKSIILEYCLDAFPAKISMP